MSQSSQPSFSATRIAELAQIELSAQESEAIELEFKKILSFVDRISQIDLADVEPWFGAVADHVPLRDDVIQPGVPAEIATQNASAKDGPYFLVPDVFETDADQPS